MAATASASSSTSAAYHHHHPHHTRRQSHHHLLSPHQAHHSPSPHSSPLLPPYSPLSSGLPSPSFPSPIPLPSIPRGRSPTPHSTYYHTHPHQQQQVSRHPSRQQSVRRLSSISGFSALSRTPTTTQFESFDHHDFSTIQEEVLSEGDVIGQGDSLHGETIELVHIPTSAARPEQSPPSVHLEVVGKLGAGSYAVVYLVREILSRTLVERSTRGRRMGMGLQFGDEDAEMEDDVDDGPRWEYEYGREFAVKCLSKASLSPEELVIQMFEATLHQSLPTHPNIVTLHRTLQTPSFLLLVLESVPGQDLFYFLEQSRDSNPSLHHPPTPHSDPLLLSTQPSTQPPPAPSTSSSSFRSHSALNLALSTHTPPTPSLLSQFTPNSLLSYARLKLITSMFAQMCDAVDACHQRGVSHRDIKPENFIVTEGVSDAGYAKVLVKLSDFGLATTQQESADVDCGSAPYMSYECRNNVAPTYATQPADVWSLGIVLINMLYHHNPWSDTATVSTTQTEFRRHTGQLNVTTITTFNPSAPASSPETHSCPSFSAFLASPVQFFLQRFPGMTPPVADFLANRVFCVLDSPGMVGGGHARGWSGRRATAREFGEWVRRLPGLMGQGVGLGLVNTQQSSNLGVVGSPRAMVIGGRPAPLERRPSRLASEMWLDEDENENENEEEMTPEGREREREREEEREVEQLMMLPLEPQSPRGGQDGVGGGPPSTFVWDKVLMASSATLVKLPSPKEAGEELSPSPLSNGGMDYSPLSPTPIASIAPPVPMPSLAGTGTTTPPTTTMPSSDSQTDLTQSARSPSAKRRGKRGARRKDKSQPPSDPHSSSAVQSPLLGATGMDDFPSHLDLLANDVETLASSISLRGSTKSSRMSATERALARLPPSPSVPPPLPPPGLPSVAKISALGRRLSSAGGGGGGTHVGSMSQASLASSLANGVGFGDIGVGRVPVAMHQTSGYSPKALSPMPEEERESPSPVMIKTAPSPFSHSPAPVVQQQQQQQQAVTVKKSWRSRLGLNSSSSPSPSPPPPVAPSHATPSALESPMSMLSLKPIQSKSSLRNEVARGPGASPLSASETSTSPAAVATSSPLATGPRYNDLYPGQPPVVPVFAPAPSAPPPAPPVSVPSSSTSPPNLSALRARQGMEAPSWRSSLSTTHSSVPSSSAASIMTSSGSSTFTRFSNSSVRSVSTMATSAASSMKSDGRSWREQQLAGDDRPRPRKGPSNVKRMDGIPRELDGLRTSLYQPPQPPRIKGVLSNNPQIQNDPSFSPPNQQQGGGRPRKPPQPPQPYEPVTLFPAYLHHRKPPPARLDSIAEAKGEPRTSPTSDTKLAPMQSGGSGNSSGKLREAASMSDLTSTVSRTSASTSASADVDKSSVNQKGQGTALQKMFWGLKR